LVVRLVCGFGYIDGFLLNKRMKEKYERWDFLKIFFDEKLRRILLWFCKKLIDGLC
jgi:hypothetical protein